MTTPVFLAVLFAAFLHAAWNALIKLGENKVTGMAIMTLVQGGIGVLVALTQPLPHGEVWLWLLASGLFHSAYKVFLAFAYDHGDLSRVYPIARGAAPLFVLLTGSLFLSDALSNTEYLGVFLLGAGILLMGQGVFGSGESTRLIPLALGSALMTAGYSIVDGLGARVAGDAVMYVAWLFIFDAALFTPVSYLLRGRRVLHAAPRAWALASAASVGSYGAYAIAVWAMTVAPIALVAALRETSILFAVLIGWIAFGERMSTGKAIAALAIVGGVALTRL